MTAYCPDAGDVIWLDFQQAVANEQAGRRPALVLSPLAFNELTGRCIACAITRRDRDWSFHVAIPDNDEISGVVQADQLRSASWAQRGSRFICRAPVSPPLHAAGVPIRFSKNTLVATDCGAIDA